MADRNEDFMQLFAANQRRIYGFVAAMIPRTADRAGRSVDATYKALSRIHGTLMQCIERALLAEEGR